MANSLTHPAELISRPSQSVRLAGLTGLFFALLQSACAAVLAISGLRVILGFTALAAAGGTYAPAAGLHQDAIRIPMIAIAGAGAIVNLAVLIRVWSLRSRTSARWRRRAINARERRSERLQFALALLTLLLIAAELVTHPMIHKLRHSERQTQAPSRPLQLRLRYSPIDS